MMTRQRTTFGVSVHGIEFDVIHVRNNENVLSLDFTHSSEAKESKHFMDDLQTLVTVSVSKSKSPPGYVTGESERLCEAAF